MIHWKTHTLWAGALIAAVALTAQLGKGGAFSDAEDLIILPSKNVNVIDGAVLGKTLFVSGTWQLQGGEKDGFPKNYSQYRCNQRSDGYCQLTETRLYKNSIHVDTNNYIKIAKWDDQQVVLEDSGGDNCRDFIVVVDLLTYEVTGITKDTPNRAASCEQNAMPIAKPRIAKLIYGFDISFPPPETK